MTPMRRRRAAAAGVLLAVATGTLACREPATARDHVLAIVTPYLAAMPFHIAEQEGYFEAQGLDVELRSVARVQDIMAAVANGDADFTSGMLAVNELGLAAKGARLRMVSTIGEMRPESCSYPAILARREHLESGALDDPARIRRMRFDFTTLLPFGYFLDRHLADYGLTIEDIEGLDVPPPAALELLPRGDIDVTLDSEPFVTRHLLTGEVVRWRDLNDLLPGYPLSLIMFGPTLLDERPEVGERVMVAMLQAMRQFRQGKTPRNLAIVGRVLGLEPDLIEQICWPTMSEDARIDAAILRPYQEWSVAHGLADRVLDDHELFDHRFIEHANQVLDQGAP